MSLLEKVIEINNQYRQSVAQIAYKYAEETTEQAFQFADYMAKDRSDRDAMLYYNRAHQISKEAFEFAKILTQTANAESLYAINFIKYSEEIFTLTHN